MKYTLQSIEHSFYEAISIGDTYHIVKQIKSLIKSQSFSSVSVFENLHKTLIAEESTIPIEGKIGNDSTSMDILGFALLLRSQSNIQAPNGKVVGIITAYREIPLSVFLLANSLIAIFAILYDAIIARSFKAIGMQIGRPIQSLAHHIEKTGENRNSEISFEYREVESVAESFQQLWNRLAVAQKIEKEAATAHAIAKTTQMLAHDVRKPFTTLQAAMTVFANARSYDEVQTFLPVVQSSVEKSLFSVNGMLQDIMELGRETPLSRQPISPRQIVKHSLEEVAQIFESSDIKVSYTWAHTSSVNVDPEKTQRVFSNIFANAIQAMCNKGHIWIKTRELDGLIEFILGNSGSFIPEEDCDQLFEAFFTKGKKGGTGLGLAIAKKIVEAHGGKIRVVSNSSDQTVEFVFTIQTANNHDPLVDVDLPNMLYDFQLLKTPTKISREPSANQVALIDRFQQLTSRYKNAISIAVLDDEEIYRSAFLKLTRNTPIEKKIRICEFSTPRSLLTENISQFDFVITDVDLQDPEINGYDVVDELMKRRDFQGATCIHSNKALIQDYRKALEVGATAFLPKPMSLDHLLKFIIDNISHLDRVTNFEKPQRVTTNLPQIAFVDDDEFILKLASSTISDAKVLCFSSPEEILDHCQNGVRRNILAGVVIDHFYGSKSRILGLELVRILRNDLKYSGAVILFSDGDFDRKTLNQVDLHLNKSKVLHWENICERLGSTHPAVLADACRRELPIDLKDSRVQMFYAKARHDIQGFLTRLQLASSLLATNMKYKTEVMSELQEKLTSITRIWNFSAINAIQDLIEDPCTLKPETIDQIYLQATRQFQNNQFWNPTYQSRVVTPQSKYFD